MNVGRNGYRHKIVTGETPEFIANELFHAHKVFSNLKAWLIGTHHGVSHKHLQAYLNEFAFRYNNRANPLQAFASVLGVSMRTRGPKYEELYSVGEEGGWTHPNPLK